MHTTNKPQADTSGLCENKLKISKGFIKSSKGFIKYIIWNYKNNIFIKIQRSRKLTFR